MLCRLVVANHLVQGLFQRLNLLRTSYNLASQSRPFPLPLTDLYLRLKAEDCMSASRLSTSVARTHVSGIPSDQRRMDQSLPANGTSVAMHIILHSSQIGKCFAVLSYSASQRKEIDFRQAYRNSALARLDPE